MKLKKGFTLIELLVVIAIIGILSTLAVVALNTARQKSRDAKRVSDIKQIQTALELFFGDKSNAYPSAAAAIVLGTGNQLCLDSTAAGFVATCATPPTFMGQVPHDPQQPATPVGDGSVQEYVYKINSASTSKFAIFFKLEGPTGDLAKGGNCATNNGISAAAAFVDCVLP